MPPTPVNSGQSATKPQTGPDKGEDGVSYGQSDITTALVGPGAAGFGRSNLQVATVTSMKPAFLSLIALVSTALAIPSYSPQSVFGVSDQDIQGTREGVNPIFDKAQDKVKQWVQDGRDFINHNGLTCQSSLVTSCPA